MTLQNEKSFDYQAEADKTCSVEFRPGNVNRVDLLRNLRAFAEIASVLNVYKKLLFRGKTPAELNMKKPSVEESLFYAFERSEIDLIHGIVGSATEAGELAEILIDLIEGSAGADRVNAIEEVGDQMWYLNRILRWADVSFEQCGRANIEKLHGRGFANGFDMFADANRDLDAERVRLEASAGANSAQASLALPCGDTLPLGPHGDETPA